MFSPFQHSIAIDNLTATTNSTPTALLLYSDQLYIGTQDGSLYVYEIQPNCSPLLTRSFTNLTCQQTTVPTAIDSLNVIKEINSLVILSAANLLLYDLNHLKLQSNCSKWTKSLASSTHLQTTILRQANKLLIEPDSINTHTPDQPDHLPVLLSILAVPCKRRLVLFSWKDGEWLSPKEIHLPHQVRSLTFPTPLNLFLGYSTGDYATIKLSIPSNSQEPIAHQISDPFPSPITPFINRTLSDSPNLSSLSNPSPKVSGLSSLAFKTTGLVSLGLTGPAKVARNSVIKLGPPSNELIGIKEQIATFLNHNGKLSRSQSVHSGSNTIPSSILYPTPPSETIVRSPYLLSLLPISQTNTSLFVHSIPTLSHLQTLQFPSPTQDSQVKSLSSTQASPSGKKPVEPPLNSRSSHRQLLTSSPNSAIIFLIGSQWNQLEHSFQYQLECLQMKPWAVQIQQLIELGEYEEALGLMEGLDEINLPGKATLLKKLNALCGVIDFSKYKYDRAIDTFINLSINPAKVVALYPPVISGSFSKKREEWEELFGGRSAESYRSTPLVGPHPVSEVALHHHLSRAGSDVGSIPRGISHPPATMDDDRHSILSGPSVAPTKSKLADPSLPKVAAEEKSQDDVNFRSSVEVLIRYLTDRRQQVNRTLAAKQGGTAAGVDQTGSAELQRGDCLQSSETLFQLDDRPITEIETLDELVQVAKVIDTSLFKSYLAFRPTMLGPLCRLPNWCEVEQVEGLLMEAKRYHELLDLYHGKGQHAKALKLLKKMAMNEEDGMTQIGPTVRYLQKLGSKHIRLILESSKWVFSLCQEQEEGGSSGSSLDLIKAALEIFVADLSAVESLPKHQIVTFLNSLQSATPAQLYLEFVVRSLKEKDSFFHEKLIQIYVVEFKKLRGLGQLERAQEIYQKLLDHLHDSTSYSSNWVLGRLPPDDMYEARALTLGNMGQHDTALRIYVERLGDLSAAEDYCKRVYEKTGGTDGSIFLCLLKICLRPTMPMVSTAMEVSVSSDKEGEEAEEEGGDSVSRPDSVQEKRGMVGSEELLEAGLRMINQHGHKIAEVDELVQLVPPLVPLSRLGHFFRRTVSALGLLHHRQLLLNHCLNSNSNALALARLALEQRRVKIDLKRLCSGCGKRLGNSVIAVHPPYGEVTHYQCQERFSDPNLRRL